MSQIPDQENDEMGLPSIWGKMGNLEVLFYSKPATKGAHEEASLVVLFYYDDEAVVDSIVDKLEALNLLIKHSEFDRKLRRKILDPDGRVIELLAPSPFHA